MAQVFPSDPLIDAWQVRGGSGFQRELAVLRLLQASLPETYCLFHGIEWRSVYNGFDRLGEFDIVVMNQAGDLLVLEIKAGPVETAADDIYKEYAGGQRKNVGRQCRVQLAALITRLKEAGLPSRVAHLLVLPDHRLSGGGTVGLPRARIIDADEFNDLPARVLATLPEGASLGLAGPIRDFLLDHFHVIPSIDALRSRLSEASSRLSDGLATWVPRMHMPSGIFKIQATAGSGKTQLALQLLNAACRQGKQAGYVCFNRPLSEQVAALVHPDVQVATFHELAVRHYRRTVGEADFSQAESLDAAAIRYAGDAADGPGRHDVLVIDESQDFAPEWLESLAASLKPEGRLYVMGDEDQRLYGRDAFDMPDAITITSPDNFRSPRSIVETINALGLASRPVTAKSAFAGHHPAFLTYDDADGLIARTTDAVGAYLRAGHAPSDIVVLSYAGLARTHFSCVERIGLHSIRRHAGYDATGAPRSTDGDLLVDTVYRFKGRSAPVVILAEIDFELLTESHRRKLFVGLTRASMAMTLIMTPRTENALAVAL